MAIILVENEVIYLSRKVRKQSMKIREHSPHLLPPLSLRPNMNLMIRRLRTPSHLSLCRIPLLPGQRRRRWRREELSTNETLIVVVVLVIVDVTARVEKSPRGLVVEAGHDGDRRRRRRWWV